LTAQVLRQLDSTDMVSRAVCAAIRPPWRRLCMRLPRCSRVVSREKPAKTCPIRFPRKSKDKLMNILPGNMRFGAGKPVKRLEDQRLLTGKGQFIDDKPEDGALWLHVLRSPHAHAKIRSIDTSAAAAMDGVAAVFTGEDLVKDDVGTIPTLAVFVRPDGK